MLLLLLTSCTLYQSYPEDTGWGSHGHGCDDRCSCALDCTDVDEDLFCADDPSCDTWDCDDSNPDVHPGRVEICNGIDDNCVNGIDEGLPDSDGDSICDGVDFEDCDGLDNDGDGLVDEGYLDTDGDGIADCVDREDCDGLDNDGDGEIDEGHDADGDGSPWCYDCDDANPFIYPGAPEDSWGGVDEDCDGLIDETAWRAGDLVITEVMSDPRRVSDTYGEWVELRNASGRDVVLDGLVLLGQGLERHVIGHLAVARGERVVLGREDDPNVNGRVDMAYEYTGMWLSEQDALTVQLEDPGSQILILDHLAWYDTHEPTEYGASRSLDGERETASDNDDPSAWCLGSAQWGELTDLGSPGEANPDC